MSETDELNAGCGCRETGGGASESLVAEINFDEFPSANYEKWKEAYVELQTVEAGVQAAFSHPRTPRSLFCCDPRFVSGCLSFILHESFVSVHSLLLC